MSCLSPTGFSTQVQRLGLSSNFLWPPMPDPKLSSKELSKRSIKWKVVFVFNGLPPLSKTAPPVPAGSELVSIIQSPVFAGVAGVLANRSPSIPNPTPVGGLNGAMPPGSGGQFVEGLESVNDVEAVAPEDTPVAVAKKPWPRKLCWTWKLLLTKLPLESATAVT